MDDRPDVQYFLAKCVRRGLASYGEIKEFGDRYGPGFADSLAERLGTAGVRLIADSEMVISPQTNVLMNDLALAGLVSLALQLPVAPKLRRFLHKDVLHQRSYELDLKRLDYLDSDYEWYYLSPSFNRLQRAIRTLFDAGKIPFAKEWRDRRGDQEYLKGLIANSLFVDRIVPRIREHYMQLSQLQLLVRWIRASGERAPTMIDIVRAGVKCDGPSAVRSLLLSDQPSIALSAVRQRRDVCFSCPPDRRCPPLQGAQDPMRVLREYRLSTLDALLSARYPGAPTKEWLLGDKLVLKFYVPYTTVVTVKKFMVDVGVLHPAARLLYKNAGKYCPRRDRWPLAATT